MASERSKTHLNHGTFGAPKHAPSIYPNWASISLWMLFQLIFGSPVIAQEIKQAESKNLSIKSLQTFGICAKKDSDPRNRGDCITEYQVLEDLYRGKSFGSLRHFGLIGQSTFVTVINSIKFLDGKDTYAIFFAQKNEIDKDQGLTSCRACSATLGIAVYQHHNKWKLFAANNAVVKTGEWGKIEIDKENLKVFSLGTEKFMIFLESSSIAQGYETAMTDIIGVNTSSGYQFTSDGRAEVRYLGSIETASSDCGAKEQGGFWVSKLALHRVTSSLPEMRLTVLNGTCGKSSLTPRGQVVFKFDYKTEKYIPK
jgi:hypothetical protein